MKKMVPQTTSIFPLEAPPVIYKFATSTQHKKSSVKKDSAIDTLKPSVRADSHQPARHIDPSLVGLNLSAKI